MLEFPDGHMQQSPLQTPSRVLRLWYRWNRVRFLPVPGSTGLNSSFSFLLVTCGREVSLRVWATVLQCWEPAAAPAVFAALGASRFSHSFAVFKEAGQSSHLSSSVLSSVKDWSLSSWSWLWASSCSIHLDSPFPPGSAVISSFSHLGGFVRLDRKKSFEHSPSPCPAGTTSTHFLQLDRDNSFEHCPSPGPAGTTSIQSPQLAHVAATWRSRWVFTLGSKGRATFLWYAVLGYSWYAVLGS